jgi:uncharacterized protein (DUF983 family)
MTRIHNLCGLVHFGPICVNGSQFRQPICMACGEDVTQEQREQVARMWNQVHAMLAPMRQPKGAKR